MIFQYHSHMTLSSLVLTLANKLLLAGLLLAISSAAYSQEQSNDALRDANEELERVLLRQQAEPYRAESSSKTQQESGNRATQEGEASQARPASARPSTAHQTGGAVDKTQSARDRFRAISDELERLLIRETINPATSNPSDGGYNAAQGNQGGGPKEGEEGDSDKSGAYGYDKDIATEQPDKADTSAHTVGSSKNNLQNRPKDVGSGHDDDIIAKSFREKAQTEKDPKLRAKLWDAYRKYKKENQ